MTRSDPDTGEILDPIKNQYGEPAKGKIIGLLHAGAVVATRFYRWTVEKVAKAGESTLVGIRQARELCPVGVNERLEEWPQSWAEWKAGRAAFERASGPPWSSVNNCTERVKLTDLV